MSNTLVDEFKRIPKNFEQFQTCDFPQKFEKLAQICGQAAVLKKISFFCGQNLPVRKKHPFLCQMTVSYIDRGVRNFDTPIFCLQL